MKPLVITNSGIYTHPNNEQWIRVKVSNPNKTTIRNCNAQLRSYKKLGSTQDAKLPPPGFHFPWGTPATSLSPVVDIQKEAYFTVVVGKPKDRKFYTPVVEPANTFFARNRRLGFPNRDGTYETEILVTAEPPYLREHVITYSFSVTRGKVEINDFQV